MSKARESLLKSGDSLEGIKKSINAFGASLRAANNTSSVIIREFNESNRDRKNAILRKRDLFEKRREAVRKREREDIVEAGKVDGIFRRTGKVIGSSTKGFLGRVMDYLGTVLVGWMVTSLPLIVEKVEELSGRVQQTTGVLKDWFDNTISFFGGFFSGLGSIYNTLTVFDIDALKKSTDKSTDSLFNSVDSLIKDFNRTIQAIVDFDLSESLGLGKKSKDDTPSTQGGGTPGTAGKLLPIHKKALDIIAGPESGGDYNAMNNGQPNDRPGGAKKWLGKNLTDMTIGEVKDFQNNKKTLWAAGRYQIIPGTLPTAQRGAGLSDNDKFDEANQDLMGIALLKIQGHEAWSRYSSYTPAEISVMEKAKATPYGEVKETRPSSGSTTVGTFETPSGNITIDPNKRISVDTRVQDTIKTDYFGSMGAGRTRPHGGADYACPTGTYIACKMPCKVVEARWQKGYGYYCDIIIPKLSVRLRFAHLSVQLISSGEVSPGVPFAQSGNTGRSTGPHIHMEATKNLSGTAYGGDMSPDPYTDVMIFSKNPPVQGAKKENGGVLDIAKDMLGFGGPSLESMPSRDVAGGITPEKRGQVIPVPIPTGGGGQQSSPPPASRGGGGGDSMESSGASLNTVMATILLRELEYV